LILAARGIVVSYETIREWSLRFGRAYAKRLKRRRPQPGDKWFWTRCSFASGANSISSGERLISMAMCSTCWFRAAGTPRRTGASPVSC
jgi:hypothetical protein